MKSSPSLLVSLVVAATIFVAGPVATTTFAADEPGSPQIDVAGVPASGYWIDVPADLGAGVDALVARLNRLAETTRRGDRNTVLLRLQSAQDGDITRFEDALKVARAIAQPELRPLKVVAWIDGDVVGHRLLIALASEQILISSAGSWGDVDDAQAATDEPLRLTYESIARRRGLVSPAIVTAMLDPAVELVMLATVDGQQVLASGENLADRRDQSQVLSEQSWKPSGSALRLGAKRLRDARVAAGVVDSIDEAADLLDMAELVGGESVANLETPRGALVEINGSVSRNRARRWQSNLTSALDSGEVNTWLVKIDSSGGNIDTSMGLAASFGLPQPPLQTVAGFIELEARGDAAIFAMACRPLMMSPDSTLGGPGSQVVGDEALQRHEELIDKIAATTRRPPALMRALLNPELEVYRYTDRQTGRTRYATAAEVDAEESGADDAGDVPANDADKRWQRGERIEMAQGLSPAQAIALGLADAEVDSLAQAASRIGLEGIPPELVDRPIVRFVERLGRSNSLMFVLLMIGFFTLSAEAGAPGIGVSGFISMLCFAMYFWMKFLAGTAEWLELVAVALGLVFIAIEIFVVPGFGVFGVGGLVLVVFGVVLMSQTFVIPQNSYQLEVLTRGIWIALGSLMGLVAGFAMIRSMMPHVPLLNQLVMESSDAETIDRQERLSDYRHLAGQIGVATTVLRPAGKARFGDCVVAVVSDGSPLEAGDAVRVREVLGNRIVVEAIES